MRVVFAMLITTMLLPLSQAAQAKPNQPMRPVFRPVTIQTTQPTTIRHIRLKVRGTTTVTGY